jgi:hypothetical protein
MKLNTKTSAVMTISAASFASLVIFGAHNFCYRTGRNCRGHYASVDDFLVTQRFGLNLKRPGLQYLQGDRINWHI